MDGGGPYWGSHLFHNRNQIIPVFQIILSLFTFCSEENVKFAELIWFVQSLSSAYSSSAANFIEFKFSNSKYLFQNQIELLTIVFTWRMCSRTNEKNIVTIFYTICILYLHIKITHVSWQKKELYRRTAMHSTIKNHCILYFAREGEGKKAIREWQKITN